MEIEQDIESDVWYGEENIIKKYARCKFTSPNPCLILFHTKPNSDMNGNTLEAGLVPDSPVKQVLFLRLELNAIKNVYKLDAPISAEGITINKLIKLEDTDGQSHCLRFPTDNDCSIWLAKLRLWKFETIPLDIVTSPTHKISSPTHKISSCSGGATLDETSSSDEAVEDNIKNEHESTTNAITLTDEAVSPPATEDSLTGKPEDYPALANWIASLVK